MIVVSTDGLCSETEICGMAGSREFVFLVLITHEE
jgi:hypothetical protein